MGQLFWHNAMEMIAKYTVKNDSEPRSVITRYFMIFNVVCDYVEFHRNHIFTAQRDEYQSQQNHCELFLIQFCLFILCAFFYREGNL